MKFADAERDIREKMAELQERRLENGGSGLLDFFRYTVKIQHEDGTHLVFHYAFALTDEPYLHVLTEHNGYHTFYLADLERFTQYDVVEVENKDYFFLRNK